MRIPPGATLAGTAAAALLAAGCMYVPLGNLPRFDLAGLAAGNAQVLITPRILGGGFRTQAIVARYTQDDIDHLVVKLYKLNGADEAPVTDRKDSTRQLARIFNHEDLAKPVTVAGLAPNTTNRLRAFAYSAPGDDAAHLINDTSNSVVDIKVETDDRPAIAELPVQLIDKIFDGQGTSSVEVKSGHVNNAGKEGFE